MFSTPENVFTWDPSASEINSPVVSLGFSNGGKTLKVSGLEKPVEFFVPRKDPLPNPGTFNINLTKLEWNFHRLVIDSEETSVTIEVQPLNCTHRFELYIKHKTKPKVDDFDLRKTIGAELGQVIDDGVPLSKDSICFKNYRDYSVFLSNRELPLGTYQIGVRYDSASLQELNEYEKRSCNNSVLVSYLLRIYKSKCLYWNEEEDRWKGDGCYVSLL